METLIHADIFFFITSIAVVLATLSIGVISFYVVRILRDVKDITEEARREVRHIVSDVSELREDLKEEGKGLLSKASILGNFITRKVTTRKRKKHAKETE